MTEPALYSLTDALREFTDATRTQSQRHIRPLHWHVASRLVIEGGFHPDDLTPTPPLRVDIERTRGQQRCLLSYDPSAARMGEQTVLGGLKTKDVDVVISKAGIGPCVAVSIKGTLNAFRNLTNRMEEAAGDCTNLHMAYPALVYGFLHVIKANRFGDVTAPNDVAIDQHGLTVDSIQRYHEALSRLTGRHDVRDEPSRYETVALAMIRAAGTERGEILRDFPPAESSLRFLQFFPALYNAYDLRFVFAAPALKRRTERLLWDESSPALDVAVTAGFTVRVGTAD